MSDNSAQENGSLNLEDENGDRTEIRDIQNQQLEAVVHSFYETGRLSQAEIELAQQKRIESLVPERKIRVTAVREEITRLDGEHKGEIDALRLRAEQMRLHASQPDRYGQESSMHFAEEAEFLDKRRDKIEGLFAKVRDIAARETWYDAEGGQKVEQDPFTGLHVREALLSRLSGIYINYLNSGDVSQLQRIRVKAGDMNNFKQGNDILGHDGFDDFLQEQLANSFIQLSRYLNSKQYGQEFDEAVIDKLFPKDTAKRRMLDEARGKISIDMFRMKPGADEIYTLYEFDESVSREDYDNLEMLGDSLVNGVYRELVIGRYENPNEQRVLKASFDNSPYTYIRDITPETLKNGNWDILPEEAKYYRSFGYALSSYFEHTGYARGIITNDPPTQIRLSADMSRGYDLLQAGDAFLEGVDFRGRSLVDPNKKQRAGVGMRANGQWLPDRVAQYNASVRESTATKVAATGFSSEEELRNITQRAAADKVSGLLLELTMKESEDESKKKGKKDLVVRAWSGQVGESDDPQVQLTNELALQLGSLAAAGRLAKELSSPDDVKYVMQETLVRYKDKFELELDRLAAVLKAHGLQTGNQSLKYSNDSISSIIRNGAQYGINKELLYLYYALQKPTEDAQIEYMQARRDYKAEYGKDLPEQPEWVVKMPSMPEGITINQIRFAMLDE